MNSEKNDKAGVSYWDENWEKSETRKPFSPNDSSLDNYVNLQLHRTFVELIAGRVGLQIIEVGCANSIWPIYFSQHHSAKVAGLDYSETGCLSSKNLLKRHNVNGDIYQADLFDAPKELLNQFDLLVSFGLVEHFENTSDCLKACSVFLKPGAKMLTLIPNMPGLIGKIQKWVDRKIYEVHVPLTKRDLINAHHQAGLKVLECDYFMSVNLSVVNSGDFNNSPWNKYLRRALSIPSKVIWALEKYGIKLPPNSFTSPYIIAISEKSHSG